MKILLGLIAVAGLAAGVLHFAGSRRARRASAAPPGGDAVIEEKVRAGLGASSGIDVRVRDGIVALRGSASPGERDRMLAHALSIPGVQRVYSDLESDASTLQTGAAKAGIVHSGA
jgi:osmotically-inducible protein OsmY